MVYKIVNKQCPESLWNMFQQRCSISNYNTRNYRDLHIPKLNLELTKKGFHYSGIEAWNDIPVNIRELPSLRLFRTHLKRHLMSLDDSFKLPEERLPGRSDLTTMFILSVRFFKLYTEGISLKRENYIYSLNCAYVQTVFTLFDPLRSCYG